MYRPFCLLSALVCVLFFDAAVRFFQQAWLVSQGHERWMVVLAAIIPTGYFLLLLHFLLELIIGPRVSSVDKP
jgi:membrane-bound metal-dependent hydrolase YbcI (DUF457 family)